jgi:phycocyanobilin:ferredoxin oxidoreductase
MNYKNNLNNLASKLEEFILSEAEGVEIPTEDFGWYNKRFVADEFRISHIERYSDKNLEVLHFTCFPNPTCQMPVFGCDIITTDKKPLAAFMDWSPIDNLVSMNEINQFETNYPLPDWAKIIFSPTALAIVPKDYEMEKLCEVIMNQFETYYTLVKESASMPERKEYIIASQNRYCDYQQRNERTFNVLKAKLGEEKAKHFMSEILFPKIN